jgi:ClpP class serine protease
MGGAQWSVHMSSHARAKMPNPTSERGQAQIQLELDAVEARFLASVAAGRGVGLDELTANLTSTGDIADGGGVWSPADALARGLIDMAETRPEFYQRVLATYAPSPSKPVAPSRAYLAQAAAAQAAALL